MLIYIGIDMYIHICIVQDLVKDSAPDHYKIHPFWSHYRKYTNATCVSETGLSSQDFFDYQYDSGIVEYNLFMAFFLGLGGLGALYIGKRIVNGTFGSIGAFLNYAVLGIFHSSMYHLIAHYQNDLTHLNGNVNHHSEFKRGGLNTSMVGTLPHGLIFNYIMNGTLRFT